MNKNLMSEYLDPQLIHERKGRKSTNRTQVGVREIHNEKHEDKEYQDPLPVVSNHTRSLARLRNNVRSSSVWNSPLLIFFYFGSWMIEGFKKSYATIRSLLVLISAIGVLGVIIYRLEGIHQEVLIHH